MGTKYLSISEESWHVVKESNVYGAPEPQRFRGPRELIAPGDVLIFYVKKTGSKRLDGKFVGAFKVTSTWYREDRTLWPDEVREGEVKYPWRDRLEPIKLGTCRLRRARAETRLHSEQGESGLNY